MLELKPLGKKLVDLYMRFVNALEATYHEPVKEPTAMPRRLEDFFKGKRHNSISERKFMAVGNGKVVELLPNYVPADWKRRILAIDPGLASFNVSAINISSDGKIEGVYSEIGLVKEDQTFELDFTGLEDKPDPLKPKIPRVMGHWDKLFVSEPGIQASLPHRFRTPSAFELDMEAPIDVSRVTAMLGIPVKDWTDETLADWAIKHWPMTKHTAATDEFSQRMATSNEFRERVVTLLANPLNARYIHSGALAKHVNALIKHSAMTFNPSLRVLKEEQGVTLKHDGWNERLFPTTVVTASEDVMSSGADYFAQWTKAKEENPDAVVLIDSISPENDDPKRINFLHTQHNTACVGQYKEIAAALRHLQGAGIRYLKYTENGEFMTYDIGFQEKTRGLVQHAEESAYFEAIDHELIGKFLYL